MMHKNLNLRSLLPLPSLKNMAMSTIKEAMIAKKLEPGIMYTEATLSNELGISRTPVREALIHLASRGLIVYFPRKGFQIKSLTEKDIENLFELRLALELTIIRHITPNLTAKSLAEIEKVWTRYSRVVRTRDPVESIRANRDFHLCLAYLTENVYLISALEEIRDLIDLVSVRSLEVSSRAVEATGEHEKILAELKRQSMRGALQQMKAHIQNTEEKVLMRIRNSTPVDRKKMR